MLNKIKIKIMQHAFIYIATYKEDIVMKNNHDYEYAFALPNLFGSKISVANLLLQ